MIPLAEPNLQGRELEFLQECIHTNFVSSVGPHVSRFEQDFATFVDMPHAVATSNGTAALHIALILAGVDSGDEVFVNDFTFVASANPILYQGAVPVLVDSERDTWNLDPSIVVEELERRARLGLRQPKAIIAVHILGFPARLELLLEACERYGICLIEDAAEALGADYTEGPLTGRQVGTLGRMGCFSFNGNKIMTTGGGGMLVMKDPELARRAKHLTTQAKRSGYAYFHDEVGYNYRLTNLAAALGLAQLERLPDFLATKRAIADRYDRALAIFPELTCPPRPLGLAPTYWLYSVLFPSRWEAPLQALLEEGIQTRPLWTALHLMPPYAQCSYLGSGRVAEDLCDRGLSLPCSTHLSSEQQAQVILALEQVLSRSR